MGRHPAERAGVAGAVGRGLRLAIDSGGSAAIRLVEPNVAHMRLAIRLARENAESGRGGPFGAVVTRGDSLIAAGVNEVTLTNDPSAHAEIVAIRRACAHLGSFQLDGCVVYCSCEPCPMCLGAFYWARPSAVFFAGTRRDAAEVGFDDAFIWDELALDAARRRLTMVQMLAREGSQPFRSWQANPGRIDY